MRALETAPTDAHGVPVTLNDLDGRLAAAATLDLRTLLAAVLSRLGGQPAKGAHSYRTRQILSCFGWIPVRLGYVRRAQTSALLAAIGVTARCTVAARDRIVRCAVWCGSFAEGRGMLSLLAGMTLSVSKMRAITLEYGAECLHKQDIAAPDVRSYPGPTPRGGKTNTPHTLFCMLDGTGVPCTKADTAGIKGKQGDAGTRQIRIALFGEYAWLDKKGRPVPFRSSFSYAVSGAEIAEVTGLVRKLGMARGYGTAGRMQCLADGEDALEKAFHDAFPAARFTNDFMHASGHLSDCCENLGLTTEATGKEYRFLRGLLYRSGATAVIRRLNTRFADALVASPEASKELAYLKKRELNMNYGWLRKNGYFIASGHVEAAARVLVVRRCKQAGMHWRHVNALRISAILARLRSAA